MLSEAQTFNPSLLWCSSLQWLTGLLWLSLTFPPHYFTKPFCGLTRFWNGNKLYIQTIIKIKHLTWVRAGRRHWHFRFRCVCPRIKFVQLKRERESFCIKNNFITWSVQVFTPNLPSLQRTIIHSVLRRLLANCSPSLNINCMMKIVVKNVIY